MDDDQMDKYSAYTTETVQKIDWKPRTATTYEAMQLTQTEFNSKVRGCGFRTDGQPRQIKYGCLLSDIRRRCI